MSRFVCIMSNLAVLLPLCASTARADAPGNIYVSALQKSGGTAFGASLASAAGLPYANDAMFFGCPSCKKANASGIYGTGTLLRTARPPDPWDGAHFAPCDGGNAYTPG